MKKKLWIPIFVCLTTALAGCGSNDYETPGSGALPSVGAVDIATPEPTQAADSLLSMEAATDAALKNADVSESDVQNFKVRLVSEDGIKQYKVEFRTAGRKYDYKISAADGTILEKSMETVAGIGSGQEPSKAPAADGAGTAEPKATIPPIPPEGTEGTGTPAPTAGASQGTGLTRDEAAAIAAKDAGVPVNELRDLSVKLDYEDGIRVYEIEFDAGDMEYDYEIAVSDGKIVKRDMKRNDGRPAGGTQGTGTEGAGTPAPTAGASQGTGLTRDEAVAIAAKDAGVQVNELRDLSVKLDYEDGIRVYEIEFDAGDMEYDYEIAVSDGKIVKRDMKRNDGRPAGGTQGTGTEGAGTPAPTAGASQGTGLTRDEAVAIAAKDAGVQVNELRDLSVKLDYEDGIRVYEIEFETVDLECEYKIAVSDGTIIEREIDNEHRSGYDQHH